MLVRLEINSNGLLNKKKSFLLSLKALLNRGYKSGLLKL